jgi:hypothetical protein
MSKVASPKAVILLLLSIMLEGCVDRVTVAVEDTVQYQGTVWW